MARYVDVDKFKQKLETAMEKMHLIGGVKGVDVGAVIKALDRQPTADVVEVVRCKDCDVPHNKWLGCPNLNGKIPPPDFYCARGERKET